MKGFKSTGNGPKSGFSFPKTFGFGSSSGSVKNVSGYTRRAPKKKAVGGIVKDNIVEAPGFSDFSLGGAAKKRMGYAEGGLIPKGAKKEALARGFLKKAKGGSVSKSDAKKIAQGVVKDHVNYPAPKGHKGFRRSAVIGGK